jgi:hypothetical protein
MTIRIIIEHGYKGEMSVGEGGGKERILRG